MFEPPPIEQHPQPRLFGKGVDHRGLGLAHPQHDLSQVATAFMASLADPDQLGEHQIGPAGHGERESRHDLDLDCTIQSTGDQFARIEVEFQGRPRIQKLKLSSGGDS